MDTSIYLADPYINKYIQTLRYYFVIINCTKSHGNRNPECMNFRETFRIGQLFFPLSIHDIIFNFNRFQQIQLLSYLLKSDTKMYQIILKNLFKDSKLR